MTFNAEKKYESLKEKGEEIMSGWQPSVANYLSLLIQSLSALDDGAIMKVAEILHSSYDHEHTIFTMGNGGSGSTASHMVGDFNNGATARLAKKFKVMCLNDNMPSLSAIANDQSYESVFEEQLKTWMRPGDVVIGFSVSGRSKNILKAIRYANKNGATTIGFCGFDGGRLKKIVQHCIHVKVHDMKIAEDIHSIITHMLMKILTGRLSRKKTKKSSKK